MEKTKRARREKPTTPCQYKEKCSTRNPHHFMYYSHEHLDKIICANNTNNIDEYEVPAEYFVNRGIILDQIKIIVGLFPESSSNDDDETQTKRIKSTHSSESNKMFVTRDQLRNAIDLAWGSVNQNRDRIAAIPGNSVAAKLLAAKPYNYFLTRIASSPQTFIEPLSISFPEILDGSLGDIECSVQINFVVELDWLVEQYTNAGCLDKPLLIVHGREMENLNAISNIIPNIKTHFVQMVHPYATHHTKMMLFGYRDKSMRVIVSTANLIEADWHNNVQGLWISDRLPRLPINNQRLGESATGFRSDLVTYLQAYNLQALNVWIERICCTDFSSINVFLVTSIPSYRSNTAAGYPFGHGKVQWLLSQHCPPIPSTSPVVAQCSTLGNFGDEANSWLTTEFVSSLGRDSRSYSSLEAPSIRIIYPTSENVLRSYDGRFGGGCLLYDSVRHQQQTWLQNHLYQWRAAVSYRSRAMPHIKTYARWTDKKQHWFILTSANLSKSAWGVLKTKRDPKMQISNYEAGVLFLPKFMTNSEYFSMDASDQTTPVFPSLYDIPLTQYTANDTPFFADFLFKDLARSIVDGFEGR